MTCLSTPLSRIEGSGLDLRRFKDQTAVRLRNTRKVNLTTQRPGEGNGLDIFPFCGHRHNGFASGRAVRMSVGAAASLGGGRSSKGVSMIKASSPTPKSRRLEKRFDAFDTKKREVSNGKSPNSAGQLTDLTDLTALERGVFERPSASARLRSPGLTPTPFSIGVKSVKSVKPGDSEGVFSPPRRQTGCQFDGSGGSGVVA